MALSYDDASLIQQLAGAAVALCKVTDSDNATRGILREIEQMINPPQKTNDEQLGKPARTPIQERIATAQASSIRGVYGLFAEIVGDPETTMAELKAVCAHLGYKNIGVIPI